MKKKDTKKTASDVEPSVSSDAPLVLLKKKKRVKKPQAKATVYNESSVDKEPLIKRMKSLVPTEKTTEKAMHITIETEKVGDTISTIVETKKDIVVETKVAPEKGTTKKELEVRTKEVEGVELNLHATIEKVASLPI